MDAFLKSENRLIEPEDSILAIWQEIHELLEVQLMHTNLMEASIKQIDELKIQISILRSKIETLKKELALGTNKLYRTVSCPEGLNKC